jgi:hypothetical protein
MYSEELEMLIDALFLLMGIALWGGLMYLMTVEP